MTGKEVREIRKKYGLTQEKFAEEIDVSKSAVVSWEVGGRNPGRRSVKDIERFVLRMEAEG